MELFLIYSDYFFAENILPARAVSTTNVKVGSSGNQPLGW